jgi:cytochrome oxidase Cu insertion factor (SCO1/SenC/PrrC family)
MSFRFLLALALAATAVTTPAALAQPEKKKNEADFVKEKPAVGDKLPDLTVTSPDGKEVKLSSLRGSHVVLTFGCLT